MNGCLACGRRDWHIYLCRGCWAQLPGPTQARLLERDDLVLARARVIEVATALNRGVQLAAIELSA